MKKVIPIDYSSENLLDTADGLFDEERYREALSILNRNAALNGNDETSYFLYAEVYDELGLNDKAIHNLFKSLDYNDAEEPGECYKGLCISYMNLGDKRMCSYYYSLYASSSDYDPDESMDDVLDFIQAEPKPSPLKVVYPPELADYSDVFDKGVQQAMNDETRKAIKTFSQIPEGNSLYINARMNIATCLLLRGENDAAEAECLRVLEKAPGNILALINLANAYLEKGEKGKAKEIALKFLSYDSDSREELYKIATIYCETGMHREAYDCFTKMMYDLGTYNLNVMYFRAIAAFNAGMMQEAMDAIDFTLDVFPVSVCTLYTKALMMEASDEGRTYTMEYTFGIPDDIADDYMSLLAAFAAVSRTRAKEFVKTTDILNAILWAMDGEFVEDKTAAWDTALSVAVKIGEYDIVRDYLLERRLPNKVKMHALIDLAQRNVDESYGVVIGDIMFRARYRKISIGRKCHADFLRAYGTMVARFSFMYGDLGEKLAPVTEKVYAKMEAEGILGLSKDTDTLAMALYLKAKLPFDKVDAATMSALLRIRESDARELSSLIGEI